MARATRTISLIATIALLAVVAIASPVSALSVGKGELRGNELRVEGDNAIPNAPITADGITIGSANGNGAFDIRFSPFSSLTCTAQLSDGVAVVAVELDRCSPSTPPQNQSPTARAGADQTLTDLDSDGVESVSLDGSGSSDSDGTIVSFEWREGATALGSGANLTVPLGVGTHTITLTIADGDGATDTDTVTIRIDAQPPAGNQAPIANAGPDQSVVDVDADGIETVTLDGSASSDGDGTIVSYEWTENGSPLNAAPGPQARAIGPPVLASVIDGDTYDHLFESNQPDPPGIVPNSFGGSAASAGDVNGDGFGDVIIGAEVWDSGGEFAEGAALVFLGGPNGPTGSNPSQAHAIIETNQAGATINDVASAGDVNGDGFGDVIVGSHFYSSVLPGTQLAVDGAAFIYHGGPNGLTASGPAEADGAIFANQLTSGMGDVVDSAGDVNGDGFDDVIISVPRQGTLFPPAVPINDRSGNYGAILIFHGGPNGIVGSGFDDADTVLLPYQDTGQPLPPVDAQVGQAAGAGDINNDGFDDIVVGGTELTVYLGGPNGIVAEDIFDATDRILANPPLAVASGIGGAGIGFVVDGAGDLNNDGFADVVGSVPFRQLNPGTVPTGEGAVYVFLGGPTGLSATSVDQAHATLFGSSGSEGVGVSVAGPGDLDADGFDDLLVGAAQYPGSEPFEGVAYVFRGGAQGVTATSVADADSRLEARQADAIRLSNRFGFDGQGAGDVNGDGFADVIVGKAFYDNGELNEGAAFLYNGAPFPTNPNRPPVAMAGPDQEVVDVDADGLITFSVDGSASFDPDGTIVSYEWYTNTASPSGLGRVLLGTGASGTFQLPLVTPNAAFGHIITLVATDDAGIERGDQMVVFPQLAPDSFEFAEWGTLDNWTTTGVVALANAGVGFPDPPHVRMSGSSTMARSFDPTSGTTGLDISFWARGDNFDPGDEVRIQASVDGGPFVDYFTIDSGAVADAGFTFYGGSALPIPLSWWPATAANVTLRFQTNLSPTADFWLSTLRVNSIQAPTGGVSNRTPIADAGPDQTVADVDGDGLATVNLSAAGSSDPDGSIVSYQWRNGASVVGSASTVTVALPVGTHVLDLIVIDDQGASALDSVTVTVSPAPPAGGASLTVDLAVGSHTITLTVTDNDGATSSDTVQIVVEGPVPNIAPIAQAGPDQSFVDSDGDGIEAIVFDGSGSSDPDGSIVLHRWTRNGSPIGDGASLSTELPVGVHVVTLTVTDDQGASSSDSVTITVEEATDPSGGGEVVFVSSSSGGTVQGTNFADEDILSFDVANQTWALVLDGSDIGLGGAGARDIDAFHMQSDGTILLSIVGASTLPDVGAVDDSDILRFVPTSLGSATAGTFEFYLDGSDVGLTSGGEDIDALTLLAGGDLLLSTSGGASVPGVSGVADEDLLRFSPSSLGASTAGSWSRYLDGSDIGLANSSGEDIGGVWFDLAGDLFLTTRNTFSVAGVSGTGSDVFTCDGLSPGAASACSGHRLTFDGSDVGFGSELIDGLHISR